MKIAVCDDEKIFIEHVIQHITKTLKKYDTEYTIQQFESGEELIWAYKKHCFDVVFLDIAMPELDGFNVARKMSELNNNVILVFVSNQEQMVFSSYEYNPFWFVPKTQLSLIDRVMVKVLKKMEFRKLDNKDVCVNIEKNRVIKINLKNTAYIQSEAHYVRAYFDNKEYSESYRNNLINIEMQLRDYGFVRCHDRFLVNCRLISRIENCACVLLNGEKIPISRSKMSDTKVSFQNYLRR